MLKLEKESVYAIELEMSTICQANCPLCYRNYKSFPKEYMIPVIRQLPEIINQLDGYCNLNYVMLVGCMSEPTLYPNFIELVKYLKNRNIKIEICTNGDTHNDDSFWYDLGKILDIGDSVYFTICGSSQELHEKYRRNTKLHNILNNASKLRSIIKVDYAQCIRFQYNSDNLDSEEFKKMVSVFSHVYMTETFFPKEHDNYIEKFDLNDFMPYDGKVKQYKKVVSMADFIFKRQKSNIACQNLKDHMIQIDIFGNVYPCYLFLEYSNLNKWDGDYKKIEDMKYECCKFCERTVQSYCLNHKLDYIK